MYAACIATVTRDHGVGSGDLYLHHSCVHVVHCSASTQTDCLLARSSFFWAFGTVSGSTSTTATLSVRASAWCLGVVHIHTGRSLDRLASSNLTPTHAHANLSYACRLELSPSARRRTYVQRYSAQMKNRWKNGGAGDRFANQSGTGGR